MAGSDSKDCAGHIGGCVTLRHWLQSVVFPMIKTGVESVGLVKEVSF